MKLYFAGPLFTAPERAWNSEVASALRAAGHEVFLPQEKEPGLDAPGIFAGDVGDYNAMLTRAATARIDLPGASTADVIAAILGALSRIDTAQR